MFPQDGSFAPYKKSRASGRIFVLKFSSSSQRHLFWLQSKSQSPNNDPAHFSSRDLKIGEVVDSLLQGEEVDMQQAASEMRAGRQTYEDEDETMEDAEGQGNHGDMRDEGEDAREGGADGGRA